jgi:anaerobic magnesium-protoporphyrin IX monomethyl ester cyclase
MYDVLLVNPSVEPARDRKAGYTFPWIEGGHGWIPQFAVFLAPYLKLHGFSVKVIDMELYGSQDEGRLLSEYLPLARTVGISAMTAQVPHALALTRRIKNAHPHIPVVWGGIHPSLFPDQTVAHPLIDYVVVGEGEEPLVSLLSGKDHPRVATKQKSAMLPDKGSFLPAAELPDPDYSVLEMDRNFSFQGEYRNVDVLTSRGCPYKCTFCVNTIIKSAWRGYDVPRAVNILRKVRQDYGAKHVFMMDENFFGAVSRAREIIAGIVELGITWEANLHIRNLVRLDDGFFRLMKQSGVVRLRMGAESGSNRILGILRKNITTDDIAAARDRCLQFGITPIMSFMIHLPDELPSETQATMKIAEECARAGAGVIGPQPFRPYPGNEEHAKLLARGLKMPETLEEWETCDLYNTLGDRPKTTKYGIGAGDPVDVEGMLAEITQIMQRLHADWTTTLEGEQLATDLHTLASRTQAAETRLDAANHELQAIKNTAGYRAVERLRRSWCYPLIHKIARSACARHGATS